MDSWLFSIWRSLIYQFLTISWLNARKICKRTKFIVIWTTCLCNERTVSLTQWNETIWKMKLKVPSPSVEGADAIRQSSKNTYCTVHRTQYTGHSTQDTVHRTQYTPWKQGSYYPVLYKTLKWWMGGAVTFPIAQDLEYTYKIDFIDSKCTMYVHLHFVLSTSSFFW